MVRRLPLELYRHTVFADGRHDLERGEDGGEEDEQRLLGKVSARAHSAHKNVMNMFKYKDV